MTRTMTINRAPVLTLERAVAGLNAYATGVRPGLFSGLRGTFEIPEVNDGSR